MAQRIGWISLNGKSVARRSNAEAHLAPAGLPGVSVCHHPLNRDGKRSLHAANSPISPNQNAL